MGLLWALAAVAVARIPGERVIYAVNCGSSAPLRSVDGFSYSPDTRYSQGTKVSSWQDLYAAPGSEVKYTNDSPLYFNERWAAQSFTYRLPVLGDGHYVIITQHAENAFDKGGERVWDHYLGARRVEAGVDPVRELGPRASLEKYYEVELRGNKLLFEGETCADAYANGMIVFTFGHTGRDNPLVNGIVVLRGRLADTDYPRRAEIRAEFDAKSAQQQRMQNLKEKYAWMMSSNTLRQPRRNDLQDFIDAESVVVEAEEKSSRRPLALLLAVTLLSLAVHFGMKFLAEVRSADLQQSAPVQPGAARQVTRPRTKKQKRE